jgi:hypothetical protein
VENVIRMHGTGHAGRLPPVVSSLFSVKAAHWRDGIRGTELGARGKERTARQRRLIGYQFSDVRATRLPLQALTASSEQRGVS